ncbi:MAG: electron transport protein SCO1/SenC [Frankiales bacterium]|jgi:protein SCO1/2|nr:electron transport protein SCO1/SenC [Frankiales bacterium]
MGVWSLTMLTTRCARSWLLAVLATALSAGLLTACSQPRQGKADQPALGSSYRGDVLGVPEVLTAAVGGIELSSGAGAVTLAELQRRQPVLLLYFGFTNCPDVCPTTVADIGIALRGLTPPEQRAVQAVFVTSDPVRDTAAVLAKWLSNFDAGLPRPFIGLRGPVADVDALGAALGVPLEPPTTAADGTIDVEHGTQVLAFVNGTARLAWLSDATPDVYRHDLALLTKPFGV